MIDSFNSKILINPGTCGGFEEEVALLEIISANTTLSYDIVESMGDAQEAIDVYGTLIDLSRPDNKYPV